MNKASETSPLIDIKLQDINQLFHSLDPSPFNAKDLDARAEEFIVTWARELAGSVPPELTIHLDKEPNADRNEQAVQEAVHNYFKYRAEQMAIEGRELLNDGWKNLAIGLTFLSVCLFIAQYLGEYKTGTMVAIIQESLLIGGWVAMWRPMQIFLYDRWPIRRMQKLYCRLACMKVQLLFPHEK